MINSTQNLRTKNVLDSIKTIALLEEMPEKYIKDTAEVLNNTLEDSTESDIECDPLEELPKAFINTSKLDRKSSEQLYKTICDVVNNTISYSREISSGLTKYGMSASWMENYSNSLRILCTEIKTFNKQAETIKDKKDIDRIKNNIQFAFSKLQNEYKKLLEILSERKSMDIKPDKGKIIAVNIWSFIKWLWKYKYSLWIIGLLVYNITTYVYLPEPVTDTLGYLTRICGAICYTFASDPVSLNRLSHTVIDIFSVMALNLTHFLPFPGSGLLRKFGKQVNAVCNGLGAVFMFFTTQFISYLMKMICITVVNVGAAIAVGEMTATKIWEEILDLGSRLKDKGEKAVMFVVEFFKYAGDSLSKFVISIIDQGSSVINMVKTSVVDKISSLSGGVYNLFSWGGQTVVSTSSATDLILKNVENSLSLIDAEKTQQLANIIKTGNVALLQANNKVIAIDSETVSQVFDLVVNAETPGEAGKQLGLLINSVPDTMNQIVQKSLDIVTETIKSEFKKSGENIGQEVLDSMENTMKAQGTFALYNKIKNINITGKETVILVLLVFTLIEVFKGVLGF